MKYGFSKTGLQMMEVSYMFIIYFEAQFFACLKKEIHPQCLMAFGKYTTKEHFFLLTSVCGSYSYINQMNLT